MLQHKNRSRGMIAAAVAGLALAAVGAPRAGAAVTTVYSDLTPDASGTYQAIGGAATVGTGVGTQLIADDVTPIAGHTGETVSSVQFYLFNGGTSAVTFDAELRFYDNTGSGDASGFFSGAAPGTVLSAFDTTTPLTLTPGVIQSYTISLTGSTFALPAGTFWAGLALDNGNGTTAATADQLNAIGPVYSNPVTIGSSQDEFFQSDDAGTFTGNNPAGGLYSFSSYGDPTANFGLALVTTSAVPEPASLGIVTAVAAVGLGRRRRVAR